MEIFIQGPVYMFLDKQWLRNNVPTLIIINILIEILYYKVQ